MKKGSKILCLTLLLVIALTATVYAVELCDYYPDGHHRPKLETSIYIGKKVFDGVDTIFNPVTGKYEEEPYHYVRLEYEDIYICKCGWYSYKRTRYKIE
ncbi:hypothetical protein JYG23_09670 [Sedimentibacter sp. zth1]|uniref:hypothetical protein n=1 Tax=Sedimentibacter sp. zth1 TaxID=2816908 RepID=UPI001A92EA11|nr:hypothetical protein [Sedimentibacter sp. zth1]QSX04957.1 hypothetical protein JYG23_09670 [Sedimentibacter sp. zth1]